MSLILVISITIRLIAMGWSIVLLQRIRDWRIGLMTVMFGLMGLRQLLTLLKEKESWAISVISQPIELVGLVVSILALMVVVFLGLLIRQKMEGEEGLRKGEQHLRNILDSLFILVGLMKPDGTLIEANKGALQMAGLKPEEVLGKPFEEAYWWSYSDSVKQQLREAIQRATNGETSRYDVVVRIGEKRFITIDFCLQPLLDEEGKVTYLVPSAIDITERVQLEKEAVEQMKVEKAIGRILHEGLRSVDLTATARACLEVAMEITSSEFGFVGELNEQGTFDTICLASPAWEACQTSKDKAVAQIDNMEVRGVWGEVIKQNKPLITNDPSSHPASVGTPEGHPPLQCFLGVPLSRNQKAFGAICVANKPGGYTERDLEFLERLSVAFLMVLERSRAGEALQKKERFLSDVFASIKDGISILDKNMNIIRVNPAMEQWYAYAMPLVGKKCYQAYHGRSNACKVCPSRRTIDTGEAAYEVIPKRSSDGKVIGWLDVYSFPLVDTASGQLNGVIEYVRDITGRRQAEEEKEKMRTQLFQAQKMEAIGILAGGIAHDFNNLLTTIQGYTELAMMGLNEDDPLHHDLKQIHLAAMRAADLTRQLLLFSRRQPMEFAPLNIKRMVDDLQKMLERLIGEDIIINTEMEPDLWTVRADKGNIEQVIMNLVVNARDIMPEGGTINIKAENVILNKEDCKVIPESRPGRFVCLSVEDTGMGMDKETIRHIFEPFFTTKEVGRGTGLGLSVVYGIVKQHEGWINVESVLGKGSKFKIYLPAYSAKLEDEAEKKILLAELQGSGERILLVEDEKSVRRFAARVLRKNGYVVFEAENAKEALDIFEREEGKFHLIFCDVVLPDQSGLKLIEQFLSRKEELRVLMNSGYTNQKSQWPIIREKGFQFLPKPYSLVDLLQAVREGIKTRLKKT